MGGHAARLGGRCGKQWEDKFTNCSRHYFSFNPGRMTLGIISSDRSSYSDSVLLEIHQFSLFLADILQAQKMWWCTKIDKYEVCVVM